MYTPPTPTRSDKTISSRRRRRCVLGFRKWIRLDALYNMAVTCASHFSVSVTCTPSSLYDFTISITFPSSIRLILLLWVCRRLAAVRRVEKYCALQRTHFFQPIAVESLDRMNFLTERVRKISAVSCDDRENTQSSYQFQRISILIQCYNAILLHVSSTEENRPINGH